MSKKSFDDIEALIKQLADANEPAYEEASWFKMEKLLDKEDKRKRPFVFLWWLVPLLLAGGLITYYGLKYNRDAARLVTVKPLQNPEMQAGEKEKERTEQTGSQAKQQETPIEENQVTYSASPAPTVTVGASNLASNRRKNFGEKNLIPGVNSKAGIDRQPGSNVAVESILNPVSLNNFTLSTQEVPVLPQRHGLPGNAVKPAISQANQLGIISIDSSKSKENGKADAFLKAPDSSLVKIAHRKSLAPRLYLLAGVGGEMNGVKLLPTSNATARVGFGLGYRINTRVSLQTGFYHSTKKYVAGANDYKPKAGSYWSTVDIKSVDASCRVYEIPLSVRYDFRSKKNIAYFSTIGLSSYLMKKEDYRYQYEHYGVPYNSSAAYTGNKHLFSVLRIAAGIEKKINPTWAIQLSPGLAIPIAGVGEGQVKLFSTDLMLGVKFSPGRKNK